MSIDLRRVMVDRAPGIGSERRGLAWEPGDRSLADPDDDNDHNETPVTPGNVAGEGCLRCHAGNGAPEPNFPPEDKYDVAE